MPPESDKVIALRRLLDARFPAVTQRERRLVPTGVAGLDAALGGGLLTGTLTELVSEVPSGGSQSSLGSLLFSTRLARQRVALVDAAGTFDLAGLDNDAVAHLVWIRCASLAETWRAADLVARDPNYAVVVIDVRGFPVRELLRTKDTVWMRLQRAAESAETAIVVQSETALVPNAARRVVFAQPLAGLTLTQPRVAVIASLAPDLQRSRVRAHGGTG